MPTNPILNAKIKLQNDLIAYENQKLEVDTNKKLNELAQSTQRWKQLIHDANVLEWQQRTVKDKDGNETIQSVPVYEAQRQKEQFNRLVDEMCNPQQNTTYDFAAFVMKHWGAWRALFNSFKDDKSTLASVIGFINHMRGLAVQVQHRKRLNPSRPHVNCSLTFDENNKAEVKLFSNNHRLDKSFDDSMYEILKGWAEENNCTYDVNLHQFKDNNNQLLNDQSIIKNLKDLKRFETFLNDTVTMKAQINHILP